MTYLIGGITDLSKMVKGPGPNGAYLLPRPSPAGLQPAAMPVIQLRPRERDLPVCERYDDEAAVVRFEHAMREHRGLTEPFRLERADDRPDATWFVSGTSANRYAVDLVDGILHDACTCPDFFAAGIGTCKHIEAVRRAVAARTALRRALRRVQDSPFATTLTVVATGAPALQPLGRWTPAQFRALGLERLAVADLPSGAGQRRRLLPRAPRGLRGVAPCPTARPARRSAVAARCCRSSCRR
ncbi:MAG: helicase, Snf2 family [Myxococcaceae bacterium]|nr:helicase, Snf2 family [Myxococcaceae bacterium]